MASLNPFSGNLGHRRAAHLLRRTSFRFTKAKVDQLADMNATAAAQQLLVLHPLQLEEPLYAPDFTTPPVSWMDQPFNNLPAEDFILRRYVGGWWINEALHDEGIGHKMAFFFHQNMVTPLDKLSNSNYFDYLSLIRFFALGNYKKLIYKMSLDNMMIKYLNNNENEVGNPNENFARELLELFTIGKGPQIGPGDYTNYTETDIVEAARLLTGWKVSNRLLPVFVDTETGIAAGQANPNKHDWGKKTFSEKFQNLVVPGVGQAQNQTPAKMRQELQTFINKIFEQEATSKNICRKLYRYFVCRNIDSEIENDIITPLAQTLRDHDYEVLPALQQLLQSEHFFDADDSSNADEIIGSLIKSPLELCLQAISMFEIQIPSPVTENIIHYRALYLSAVMENMLAKAGLEMFIPADVAGYPAYYQDPEFNRSWFNSGTIIARYKLPEMLLSGKRVIGNNANDLIGIKLKIAKWVKNSGFISNPNDPFILVQTFIKYMFAETPDDERFNYFFNGVFLDNLPASDWTYEWENFINTGNSTEVLIPLERLINALMYAPEYQVG